MTKDKKVGQQCIIIGGDYKGHRGRVTQADDNQCIVELSSQCKKIPIRYSWVSPLDSNDRVPDAGARSFHGGQSHYVGETVYNGGKTPMPGQIATPSYYPQSAWGGGGNDFEKDDDNYG